MSDPTRRTSDIYRTMSLPVLYIILSSNFITALSL